MQRSLTYLRSGGGLSRRRRQEKERNDSALTKEIERRNTFYISYIERGKGGNSRKRADSLVMFTMRRDHFSFSFLIRGGKGVGRRGVLPASNLKSSTGNKPFS